jgi:predicted nucleic acid-binding protein
VSGPTHALSLYLDTAVIGGYFDPEFMADTRTLWRLKDTGHFRFVTSVIVRQELAKAPERVRALLRTSFDPAATLPMTADALELAGRYVAHGVVPASYTDDARHVALCTVARLDYLVSWNFRHLANARREAGFNTVNLLQGYPVVRIVSPRSLTHVQEEKGS